MSLAVHDDEDVALVVVEPGQQRAEQPGRDARVGLAAGGDAGQRLLDLVDNDDARGHRVDEPQRLADVAASVWPTSEPISAPTSSTSVGRPVSLPSALANCDLPDAGDAQSRSRRGAGRRAAAGPQGARAERLEGLQAAQVGERLAAPVQRQQARLLERPRS